MIFRNPIWSSSGVPPRRWSSPARGLLTLPLLLACTAEDPSPEGEATRPDEVLQLHHVGINTTDPEAAMAWYAAVWPSARPEEFAGRPAMASEMYLVFHEVDEPPAGAFDPELGRPEEQSALWHIGAFVDTSDQDRTLGAAGIEHLPLFTTPDDEDGVWRSGLAPYSGIVTADQAVDAPVVEPRPGGFSYVLAPDGALFELTGGPETTPSLSHVHLFHEEPQCAANWYVDVLGMALPTEQPRVDPCEAQRGEPGWPSLERGGTIRQPRGSVLHGNGSLSWYPRQCVDGRCGDDRPLVPTRGQVLDHVAFVVEELEAWHAWLTTRGLDVIEEVHDIPEGRAFMVEGLDGLAIELVALEGDGADSHADGSP